MSGFLHGGLLLSAVGLTAAIFLSGYVQPAFSDNLNKNVATVTMAAGPAENTDLKVKIVSNTAQSQSGDPQKGCNANDGTPAVVTFSVTPTGLTVVNNPLSISQCNTLQAVTLQSNVAGTYQITASVSDAGTAGGTYHLEPFGTVTVNVVDSTPPETAIDSTPEDPTASRDASFSFSSNEPGSTFACSLDGAEFAACTTPTSYSGLIDGSHTFSVKATDPSGNTDASPASSTWTVDGTGPVISPHANVAANTDPGLANAVVNYVVPTATDNFDSSVTVTCDPASGSTFSAGETTVTCTAADSLGNPATPVTFKVIVSDNEAPAFSGVPADITQALAPGESSATVTYTPPTANDNVDGAVTVTCDPASGSTFSAGETTVTCTATDSSNNEATASFKVLLLNIAINTVTPQSTVWGSPVSVSGTVNGALAGYTVEVEWGDDSVNSTGITITGNTWSAPAHTYTVPSDPGGYSITAYLKDGATTKAESSSVTVDITTRDSLLSLTVPETVTGDTKFVGGGTLVDGTTGNGIDGANIQFTGVGAPADVITQGVGFIGDISVESCAVPAACGQDDIGSDPDSADNIVLHLTEGDKINFPKSASKVRILLQDMGDTSFTYTVKEYPDTTLECEGLPGVVDCPALSFSDGVGEIIVQSGSEIIGGVRVYNGIKEIAFNPTSPATTLDVGIAAISTRNEDSNPQELHEINLEGLELGIKSSGFTTNAGSYFAFGVAQFDSAIDLTLTANFAGTSLYEPSDATANYDVQANLQDSEGVGGNEAATTSGTSIAKRSVGTDSDKDGLSDTDEILCRTTHPSGTTTWKYAPSASYASTADCPTSASKPDLYYEVDCMYGVTCPTQAQLDLWEKAFDDASSTKDINAHFHLSHTGICGPTIQNPVHAWSDTDTNRCNDFKSIKEDFFGTGTENTSTCKLATSCPVLVAKAQGVRYLLVAWNVNDGTSTACGTTGKGEINGNDAIIAIDCIFAGATSGNKIAAVEGTFKHEIGHNLGLDHGGGYGLAGGSVNCKVNHVSVMNYMRQVPTTAMIVQTATTATNVNWYGGFHRGEIRLGTTTGSTSIDENTLADNKLMMTGTWKNRDGATTITSFKVLWGDPGAGVIAKLKPGTTGQTLDWDGGELATRSKIDLNYMGVTIGSKQLPACTQTQNAFTTLVSPSDELVIMRNNMYKFQSTGTGTAALGILDFDQDPDLVPEADGEVIESINSLSEFNWPGVDTPLNNKAFGESGISTNKQGNTLPVKHDLYDKNNVKVTGTNALSGYHIARMDIKVALVTSTVPPDDSAYFAPQTSTQTGFTDYFTYDGSKWSFQMGTKNLKVGGTYTARIYLHFDNGGVLTLDSNGDGISFLFKIVK